MQKKSLSAAQLKAIAMTAMIADHLASVVWPGYRRDWWILLIHVFGRLAAPIFWFFVAEGFHHTRNWKRYAGRLLIFAILSHFAYNFAFGIPFVPFQTTLFNQTSVIWPLFWGVVTLALAASPKWRGWQKVLAIIGICLLAFCADWSCIAVMAILHLGEHRGNFQKQMRGMMLWICGYALVYGLFIDPLYGVLQLFTVLTIPLLACYNGERGRSLGGKWSFYIIYPLHLVICGLIRIALHGNIAVLVGA